MYCFNCGSDLPDNAIYCPYCGAKALDPSGRDSPIENPEASTESSFHSVTGFSSEEIPVPQPIPQPTPDPALSEKSDNSFKVEDAAFLVGYSISRAKKFLKAFFKSVRVAAEKISSMDSDKRKRLAAIAATLILVCLGAFSFCSRDDSERIEAPTDSAWSGYETHESNEPQNKQEGSSPEVLQGEDGEVSNDQREEPPLAIKKGSEYACMTDEWNVYIATAISDEIIKIENWSKSSSDSQSVSHEYDVGTFKINDSGNGFAWLDDEKTAFSITFEDKSNSAFKWGGTATFTVNIGNGDVNKGSNYSEEIACYSFQNDKWYTYRAIPLTDTLIKIEAWRTHYGFIFDSFLYGYDVCLVDTANGNTDFEWTDEERTSFTITMRDEQNESYWKDDALVAFILENEGYEHPDVKSYLDIWEVGDGEAAVPSSAYGFRYDNYQDVQKELETAGFTNISTAIQYDIVLGWTAEGEVEGVSIDGRTDYESGEVFKADIPIVITYHMKAEDDPDKPVETEGPESEAAESELSGSEASEPQKLPVFYSTNTRETVGNGNAGVYSYKSRGGSYDIYWIIDFDEGYVYYFTDGNGESFCDRLKIDSGDLNSSLKITYHDGGDVWSYKLHFKYENHSEHLIMNDNYGFDYDYYTTDLDDALVIRDSKTIKDY